MTADVQVVRPSVLHKAALGAIAHGITIDLGPDDEPGLLTPEREAASDAGALRWAVEPTGGLHDLMLAGAITLTDVTLEVTEDSPGRCRVAWSTTIKLEDVRALRRYARAGRHGKAEQRGRIGVHGG